MQKFEMSDDLDALLVMGVQQNAMFAFFMSQ